MYFRTTTQDLTLAETKIAEGSKVLLMVGAANRDHRRWSGPDTFDISRAQQAHLAFGRGIHTCVGQMIARLEADVLISEFLRRVESFDLLEQPVWQESNTLLGLQSLKVRVTKNSRL
jgi:cytochrome P450